ncbi:hypothetical protein SAMN05421788_11919 [Filimonas lacunae]|uniref:Uncharacterized protein n=1 Tax=Filimonas lacunae TaxID=477680 RepID=A0A173MAM6_9BACT|nr:hypothetical protein [Filimonas lacunae]BAV04570.1 hypothetical protein FLA_0562 [Filimonas lacunae]SIT34788.1 hypothetical protein SAMN05421788_11919 [Filimonas lacunae]
MGDVKLDSIKGMLSVFSKNEDVVTDNVDQYNKELQEAEKDYEQEEYIDHDEFMKQIKAWYIRE